MNVQKEKEKQRDPENGNWKKKTLHGMVRISLLTSTP